MRTVDMHCDTISALYKSGGKERLAQNGLHLDLEKMKRGDYLLQNFALFVKLKAEEDPWETVCAMIRLYGEEMEHNQETIAPVRCYEEIEKNRAAGKLSALLTVEEGGVCGGRPERLCYLYEAGVRMLTLTWNYPNELGYPNLTWDGEKPDFKTPQTKLGLTGRGIEFVEEMERLGIIPDVSHLSDAGFYDVLAHTGKPIVASHSNARSVCPCVRNLTDDMIRKLGERGGVTGLNFCSDFLTDMSSGGKNPGALQAIVEHARHITNVGGMDCLGLGSDFDGIDTNEGIPDASYMVQLADALQKGGFTISEVDKIMGSNVLRVYADWF